MSRVQCRPRQILNADLVVEHVVNGAAAEKVVRERRLVGARVEGDSLGGGLQVALKRDTSARLGRIVVEAHVTAEGLAQVNVPVKEPPQFRH